MALDDKRSPAFGGAEYSSLMRPLLYPDVLGGFLAPVGRYFIFDHSALTERAQARRATSDRGITLLRPQKYCRHILRAATSSMSVVPLPYGSGENPAKFLDLEMYCGAVLSLTNSRSNRSRDPPQIFAKVIRRIDDARSASKSGPLGKGTRLKANRPGG